VNNNLEKNLYENLNHSNVPLIKKYLSIQTFYEEKYGKNTVILMEIGSFFEIYETNEGGKSKEIAEILNIQLTRKNKNILGISEKNHYLAGIPSNNLDKYLKLLIQTNEWTIVLIRQTKQDDKTVVRWLDRIISPGIQVDFTNKVNENYILSIYIEKNIENIYFVGLSAIDISTGKTFVKEAYGTKDDNELALDEINNFIGSYTSNEVILYIDLEDEDKDRIVKKLNLINKYTTFLKTTPQTKIAYKNQIFKKIFEIKNTFLTPIEELNLEKHFYLLESLEKLCVFIIEHDIELAKKLQFPIILNDNNYVEIGNNALQQLNILTQSSDKNKSVLDVINHTNTTLGRRLLQERISRPILKEEELLRRYAITKEISNKEQVMVTIKKYLTSTYDLERLSRKISINRIEPFEFYYFWETLSKLKSMFRELENDIKENEIGSFFDNKKEIIIIEEIVDNIEKVVNVEEMSKYKINQITDNFLNEENNQEIKKYITELNLIQSKINENKRKLVEETGHLLIESDVKLKNNEIEGYYFEITQNKFKKINLSNNYTIKKLKGSVKIKSDDLEKLSEKTIVLLSKIIGLNKIEYNKLISDIYNKYSNQILKIIQKVAELDVYYSNAILLLKHNYVLPTIKKTDNEESFLEFKELRHSIIETIEENGIYIPNDLSLGNKKYSNMKNNIIYEKSENTNGILLYGINSSGKSSFNKSIGISVILAQAGIPVPAAEFNYSIFKKVYTRITGSDDIYKGLSTFAVEMKELKNILNRCDSRSLIIGDEISHGTETISGLSIVASALSLLSKRNNIFTFSTHLHQLIDLPIIEKINNLQHLHLSIKYEEKTNTLIYDRKLKLGNGSSVYGLEFAKSINMDKEFLSLANKIRREITNTEDELEMLIEKKGSKYNKNIIFGKCQLCNEKAVDIHHIKEKHTATSYKRIEYYSMNNKNNLVQLCKNHHQKLHDYMKKSPGLNFLQYIETSDGKKLWVNKDFIDFAGLNITDKEELIMF